MLMANRHQAKEGANKCLSIKLDAVDRNHLDEKVVTLLRRIIALHQIILRIRMHSSLRK